MRPRRLLLLGLLLLLLPTALLTYLLMPFPGSQGLDSMRVAYALNKLQPLSLAAGAVLSLAGLVQVLREVSRTPTRVFLGVVVVAALGLLYGSYRMSGDVLFRQPQRVVVSRLAPASLPPESLVLGVVVGEHARAYPVRLLAYHHFVMDEIDGQMLMPTY